MKSYQVEVIADGSGQWVGNQHRFADKDHAQEYGQNLAMRWMAVREWRITPSEDEPNQPPFKAKG